MVGEDDPLCHGTSGGTAKKTAGLRFTESGQQDRLVVGCQPVGLLDLARKT